jgi:hypothetical protein
MRISIKFGASFFIALAFCVISINAQQTIFNVPSSDILGKGKVYVELDATFRFDDSRTINRFSGFVPRIVAGTGGDVEVGLNLNGNIQPGADATTLVVGNNVFIPVRNKSYNIGNYAYAQVSKTIKSTNGTRLTAGGFYFTKNVVSTAARGGAQFGFEQPVNKYLNINADYYTGRHAAGYFTPGVAFKPHPRVTGYVGYQIGNDNPRSNNFFYAAIGVNLN